METIQHSLAAFFLNALAQESGEYLGNPGRKVTQIERIHQSVSNKWDAFVIRKMDTTKWFHFSLYMHLAFWIVFSVYFNIPKPAQPEFYILCLVNGWILFYGINKILNTQWIAPFIRKKVGASTVQVRSLLDMGGRTRISRFALLVCLVLSMVAAASFHAIFLIPAGLLSKWLIESQVRLIMENRINATRLSLKCSRKTIQRQQRAIS